VTLPLALVGVLLVLHAGVLTIVAVNRVFLARSRRPPPAPRTGTRAVVMIPARNEEANLARLLPSLLAQTGVEWQAVVVDDASDDATWDVIEAHRARPGGERIAGVRGSGPPPGWVGKVYALHTAAARAFELLGDVRPDDVFVFLDADAELASADGWQPDDRALARLVGRRQAAGGGALTGMPRLRDRGGAALLTSLVPFAVVAALPLPLVPRTRNPALSALNGQAWLLGADDYRRLAPHAAVAGEVLEDVEIGRYLKRSGVTLRLVDLADEVSVEMYRSFGEAWRGFRKNAYLLAGGRPAAFAAFFALYTACWVLPSVLWTVAGAAGLAPLASLWLVKALIDRWSRAPWAVTLAAPLVLALGAALQLDSAVAHARGRVSWKGRTVGHGAGR